MILYRECSTEILTVLQITIFICIPQPSVNVSSSCLYLNARSSIVHVRHCFVLKYSKWEFCSKAFYFSVFTVCVCVFFLTLTFSLNTGVFIF